MLKLSISLALLQHLFFQNLKHLTLFGSFEKQVTERKVDSAFGFRIAYRLTLLFNIFHFLLGCSTQY